MDCFARLAMTRRKVGDGVQSKARLCLTRLKCAKINTGITRLEGYHGLRAVMEFRERTRGEAG